jgi:hypothetical protein
MHQLGKDDAMHGRHRLRSHGRVLGLVLVLALAAMALVGAHAVLLQGLSVRASLPIAGLAGVAVVAVALHLGVIGAVFAKLRGHFHPRGD